MTSYFDTSALMKLVLVEAGSAEVAALWDEAGRVVASTILYPEGRAALARGRLMHRLDRAAFRRARQDLETRWAELDHVEVDRVVVLRAGDIAEDLALRGFDAVHLASAEAITDRDLVLVTADRSLGSAGEQLGLTVAGV
ncbi:MAG TPA: type II toxin-antitoxin system VapC family toxin [Acidimicrobiia bacterium]|nr:type II toxin-antitoxin system VapC family toxin [Acidimicrobiia bacterium]